MTDREFERLRIGDFVRHSPRGLFKVVDISQHKDYALGTLTVLLESPSTDRLWRVDAYSLLHTNWQMIRNPTSPTPLEEIRL